MPDSPSTPRRLAPPVAASPDAAGEFARLVEIMRLLRSPAGCPWDREQSWMTLRPYVLEEAYEVVDAIERQDADGLRSEIGDLVFEGVFLAQVASDTSCFSIADALRDVSDKLIRRHPHVFEQADLLGSPARAITTADAVVDQWEQIKARERETTGTPRAGALDGVPQTLPALTRAREFGERAAATGFDWPDVTGVLDKVAEEVAELRDEVARDRADRIEEELGDLLFALAQLARKAGLDPEAALRAANAKFSARFRALEREVEARGATMRGLTVDELEAIWQRLKRAAAPGRAEPA